MKSDVITAISTPVGIGGIAVIRVSGESAIELVSKIFQGKRDIKRVKTHTVHYGYIKDPKTNQIIDEVLVTVMRQPYSYTGEDMVEINCHGGRVVPYNVLEIVIKAGARIAEPGEFTKRAFINGRLDLVQAQAILELINARSKEGVLLAQGRLQGELSRRLKTLREKLVELLKEIEVRIDFPDEVEEFEEKTLKEALGGVLDEMGGLLSRGRRGRYYLNGATLPIVGRVNVGKSTLFNRLLDEERAIVTEIPGTTRDIISDEIIIEGLPIKLLDTAGYRKTENRLEIIGIEKTQEKLTKVDGVIFLIDASNPLDEEDITLWRELPQRKLVVLTKIDLGNIVDLSPLGKISKECLYSVSGLKGWGIEELKRGIKDFLLGEMTDTEFSISHREEGLLLSAREEIKKVFEEKSIPIDILSMRIYEVVRILDRMTGGGNVEDEVIDRIFSDFCVGK